MILFQYERQKNILKVELQKLRIVLFDIKIENLCAKIQESLANLDNEKFILVVVGEFSRGKSTFVNAMLGRNILPSSKKPTTNVISKIIYGDMPSYELVYRDGSRKRLSETEFLDIKAKDDEENNFKQESRLLSFVKKASSADILTKKNVLDNVEYAEVEYPLSFCKNNVEVVDTPGTNDLNVGRINITYNYLKHAEAAILVLSATQALSKSELEFLKERVLGNQIQDIFIVVNFKDQVEGEEERILAFVKANLAELPIDKNKIYLVSSKKALLWRRQENGEQLKPNALMDLPNDLQETGFLEFEAGLTRFLAEEKGKAKLQKYVKRSMLYINEAEQNINMRLEASAHSADELRQQLAEMHQEFTRTKHATNRIIKDMDAALSVEVQNLSEMCDSAVRAMRTAVLNSIDEYQDNMTDKEVKYLVESAITPLKKKLIEDVNNKQKADFQRESERAVQRLKTVFKDIELQNMAMRIDEQVNVALDIAFTETSKDNNEGLFGALGGMCVAALLGASGLGVLLGAFVGWNIFGNNDDKKDKLKAAVRKEFDENYKGFSEKMCSQYKKNSSALCQNLNQAVVNRLDNMEKQLQNLIDQKETAEVDSKKEQSKLNAQLQELNNIKNKLSEVMT